MSRAESVEADLARRDESEHAVGLGAGRVQCESGLAPLGRLAGPVLPRVERGELGADFRGAGIQPCRVAELRGRAVGVAL